MYSLVDDLICRYQSDIHCYRISIVGYRTGIRQYRSATETRLDTMNKDQIENRKVNYNYVINVDKI